MTLISRDLTKVVQSEIGEAAKAIFAKHGLEFKGARATYGDELSVKVIGHLIQLDDSGVNRADPQVLDYERYAQAYGLPTDGIGKTFHSSGHQYTIAGLNPKATRMPVLGRRQDGRMFKFSPETVLALLARA